MHRIKFLLILWLFFSKYIVFGQNRTQDIQDICSKIYTLNKLSNHVFMYEFKSKKTLFIINATDTYIESSYKEKIIIYTTKEMLFANHVMYWMEIIDLIIESNKAYVKFKTFNSVDSKVKRKEVFGALELEKKRNAWTIVKKIINI